MRLRRAVWAVAVLAAACADLAGVGGHRLRLRIVPVFDRYGELAAGADQLRIRIFNLVVGPPRDSTLAKDTTVTIDADGNASANINVLLLQSPQTFVVVLEALQSADGAVLFSGSQDVTVTAASSSTPQTAEIPVTWRGSVAARIVIAPRDTALISASSFTLRTTTFDAADAVINSAPRFYLVNSADASKLTVNRLTGLVTSLPGQSGEVRVYVETLDPTPPRDTARIFVGAVPGGVRVPPGFANVLVGGTTQLTGAVVDPLGNPLGGGSFTWASRSPGIATVDAAGLVTGVAEGTAVVVATSGSFVDSIKVTVPPSGNVVVNTVANVGSFSAPAVNGDVQVQVWADLRPTPNEKLASYNARLTWNVAQLTFVDTTASQTGDFPSPLVNRDSVAAGILRFAQINPSGSSGQVVLARFRLRGAAAGAAALQITLSEMSGAAPTITNLISRVTVTNGTVTVRP